MAQWAAGNIIVAWRQKSMALGKRGNDGMAAGVIISSGIISESYRSGIAGIS